MPPSPEDRELDLLAVAYLTAQGLSQNETAALLGLSQASVSRLLNQSRQRGLIQTTTRFNEEGISAERMEEIRLRAFPNRLLSQLKRLPSAQVRSVRVFYSGAVGTTPSEWDDRLERFGKASASSLLRLVRKSDVVGVAWGNTLSTAIAGLSALGIEPPRRTRPIQFVSVCGEALGHAPTDISASTLVKQLDLLLNGGTKHSVGLAAVPALIPLSIEDEELAPIKKLMREISSYRDIFVGGDETAVTRKPWIQKLDTIVTSIGSSEQTAGFWNEQLAKTSGIDLDVLVSNVIGDIAGVLLSRDEEPDDLVQKIQKRWQGITLKQIEQCAGEAIRTNKPGVIIMAIGSNKVACLRKIIAKGLVNELLIDHDLAQALEASLEEES